MNTTTYPLQALPNCPRAAKAVLQQLSRITGGNLHLVLPSGQTLQYGHDADLKASLRIHDWRVFSTTLAKGDVGFAQAYRAGWWDSPDLTALLELVLINRQHLEAVIHGHWLGGLFYRLRHGLRRNTKANSQRNIQAHYDLGNDFYRLWLDETLMYSAASFEGDYTQSLAQAQRRKNQRVLQSAGVQPAARMLEIGCGWGGLAEQASRDFQAHVTGLTLSPAQLAFAQERLSRLGLHAELRLQDYRDTQDQPFDAICSIEMFEAVGQRYWPDYFSAVKRLLKPGGKACIQTITIDDALFDRYIQHTDFIQQFIFPGGCLPCPSEFRRLALAAGLRVVDEYSLRQDYAETLKRWQHSFLERRGAVESQGFDDVFIRTWQFYLSYCEAGFRQGSTDVIQFTLAHH